MRTAEEMRRLGDRHIKNSPLYNCIDRCFKNVENGTAFNPIMLYDVDMSEPYSNDVMGYLEGLGYDINMDQLGDIDSYMYNIRISW